MSLKVQRQQYSVNESGLWCIIIKSMNSVSRSNVEILNSLGGIEGKNTSRRFVLIGSLARGVLLGKDALDLFDPQLHRFKDVDLLDTEAQLDGQYSFLGGELDTQPTKSIRPVVDTDDLWGFYDKNIPIKDNPDPLSVFESSELGLKEMHFSRAYAESTVLVPSPAAMLHFSDFYAYSLPMPKHHAQIQELKEVAGDTPEMDAAFDTYIHKMQEKYPLGTYGRARKMFFKISPKLAMSFQESNFGRNFRVLRNTDPGTSKPLLHLSDVTTPS